MAQKKKEGALTAAEKRIVKGLLAQNWRNQDIQARVNEGRNGTVNGARISAVKTDTQQEAATPGEVEYWLKWKKAIDPQTGLNRYDHEHLIRAREATILAVQVFNSAGLKFKTEVFCMLANVAWTYLIHEHYTRQAVNIVKPDGKTMALSELCSRNDFPTSEGIKQNLRALKILRDEVEHKLLGKADIKWIGIFQACCLNFNKTICELFGEHLSLAAELSFALHFAKMNLEQASKLNQYELPGHIDAIDANVREGMTPDQINSIEFQFRVIYTLDAASKSHAHFQFVNPESQAGKEIHNVLAKKVAADELFPHKPSVVVSLVAAQAGVPFTSNDHIKAWKLFKVRPKNGAGQPGNTDKRYCIYHPAHKDYTYSDEWVARLLEETNDTDRLAAVRATKL
ncbi:hypothetical protein ASG39_07405 [Rhizobium sp. Leaf371]|uniref:DUF3644 domain-containing protein n=1 Tax=Rhizobium sp. Leaf371 TaxID=1736355 RepID=UPI000712B764|nr:DUF3644 domain-containing protein [Rhizobium sp. Leaf371]KQS65091.1 hypothetical protein ASG39_07405 [Rhizobium sp. Leaf371]